MKYCGIDLHSNNSVVSVIDETDRVVAEKRLPNELPKILAFLVLFCYCSRSVRTVSATESSAPGYNRQGRSRRCV